MSVVQGMPGCPGEAAAIVVAVFGGSSWEGVKGAEKGLGEKGLLTVEAVETEVGRSGRGRGVEES
jgi:hypothetical protein